MDCCDCTYTTDVTQYPVATDTYVTDFPTWEEPIEIVPTESAPLPDPVAPVAPATTAPAPAVPYLDPVTASITNDMFIDAINRQGVSMLNLTSPYDSSFTAQYDSTTNSTGWVQDGDMTPSTPYT